MNPLLIPVVLAAGWLLGAALVHITDSLAMTRRIKPLPTCAHCQERLTFTDVLLMRPCPQCGRRRGLKAWLVPVLSALGLLGLWLAPPQQLNFWPALVIFFYFAVVVIMDLEHRVILHPVSITGAALGVLTGSWLNGGIAGDWLGGLLASLAGGLVGFGVMFALYGLGDYFRRYLSRRRGQPIDEEALGFGDVNLSGVLGLMVGYPAVILVLITGIVLGGLFSGLYILAQSLRKRYQAFTAIPYAPFLVLAGVVLIYLIGVVE